MLFLYKGHSYGLKGVAAKLLQGALSFGENITKLFYKL